MGESRWEDGKHFEGRGARGRQRRRAEELGAQLGVSALTRALIDSRSSDLDGVAEVLKGLPLEDEEEAGHLCQALAIWREGGGERWEVSSGIGTAGWMA